MFEPFFTTKSPEKGTGLGLSMVFGFVRQSGGNIRIASMLGKGTTVHIVLPTCEPGVTPEEQELITDIPDEHVILLVEDDVLVRSSTAELLHQAGYRVLEAEQADDALRILQHRNDVSMLFTDVVMPGSMDGLQLAKEAIRLCPALKVLITSGYPGRVSPEQLSQFTFIEKPYINHKLVSKIQKVIET